MVDVIRTEQSTRETVLKKISFPGDCISYTESSFVDEEESITYHVPSTGETVHCETSLNFINRYCSKLPKGNYYSPQPDFSFNRDEGKDNHYVCVLGLPPNALIQELITSPPSSNAERAKQLSCLEACKMLNQIKALDNNLLAIIDAALEEEEIINLKKLKTGGAGTKKWKELHRPLEAKALYGNWGEEQNRVKLQSYKLVFTSQDDSGIEYMDFVLLIEAKLADDIANAEIDLYLRQSRVVKARFKPTGELQLDSDQVKVAKAFHELVFSGIFTRYEVISRDEKEEKTRKCIWKSSNMYLLLPLELGRSGTSQCQVNIDWKCISECVKIVRGFENKEITLPEESDDTNMILASGPMPKIDMKNKLVLTIHTGKIYGVTDIRSKYKKTLTYANQPLLQVKQNRRPCNLLIPATSPQVPGEKCNSKDGAKYFKDVVKDDSKDAAEEDSKDGAKSAAKDEDTKIEIPPELCLTLDMPSSIISTVHLLPSVMHRMHALIMASQLREQIPDCPLVDPNSMMKALTTIRCLENFHNEALGFLGDAVLKYAVSCRLFLKFHKKHEGELSAIRSLAACNATLHALAIKRKLPGYIRDEPFNPDNWAAPGSYPRRIAPCTCNAENFEEGALEMDDNKVGKTCGEGHRWLCSKTISDCVKALIGAYSIADSDLTMAKKFMTWMDILVDYEQQDVQDYLEYQRECVDSEVLKSVDLSPLESILDYTFENKSLLVEGITHPSKQDSRGGFCYQRLEYLGDSVLDLLLTQHLFKENPDGREGELSDLRRAAVNNDFFAYVAAKHDLHLYLLYDSTELEKDITKFVTAVKQNLAAKKHSSTFSGHSPFVLGDLLEGIAGAMLVDSNFNYELVWMKMKDFLSPIVTLKTLNMNPVTEATELCNLKGYKHKIDCKPKGDEHIATFEVALEDDINLIVRACNKSKKLARKEAAQQILAKIKQPGIFHPHCANLEFPEVGEITEHEKGEIMNSPNGIDAMRKRELEVIQSLDMARKKSKLVDTPQQSLASEEEKTFKAKVEIIKERGDKDIIGPSQPGHTSKRKSQASETQKFHKKKARIVETTKTSETPEDPCHNTEVDKMGQDGTGLSEKISPQAHVPRTCLNLLYQKYQWKNLPAYEVIDREASPYSRFMAKVTVDPGDGPFSKEGEPSSNKKSAKDSAALLMISELEKAGYKL